MSENKWKLVRLMESQHRNHGTIWVWILVIPSELSPKISHKMLSIWIRLGFVQNLNISQEISFFPIGSLVALVLRGSPELGLISSASLTTTDSFYCLNSSFSVINICEKILLLGTVPLTPLLLSQVLLWPAKAKPRPFLSAVNSEQS